MRGQRRHVSAVLAEALAARGRSQAPAAAAALLAAVGPRLAREVSVRGTLRDGRLLVVVRTPEWATQVDALAGEIVASLRASLGQSAPTGLSVHVGSVGP